MAGLKEFSQLGWLPKSNVNNNLTFSQGRIMILRLVKFPTWMVNKHLSLFRMRYEDLLMRDYSGRQRNVIRQSDEGSMPRTKILSFNSAKPI